MKEKLFKIAFSIIILLAVIFLFTIIDHAIHSLNRAWSVPDYYFRNKIIFGFLWGLPILFLALKFYKLWQKSLFFSGTLAAILQMRYYWEGYPINFVITFLLIHFLILLALSLIIFKLANGHKKM